MPTGEIENAVISQIRALLRTPEMVARTARAARPWARDESLTAKDVVESLQQLDAIWEELFPAEQARVLRLIVERLEVGTEGVDLKLWVQGLHSLVAELCEAERPEVTAEAAA